MPFPKMLRTSLKTVAPYFIMLLIVVSFLVGAFTQLDNIDHVPMPLMTGVLSWVIVKNVFEELVKEEKEAIREEIRENFKTSIEEQEKVFFNSLQSIKEKSIKYEIESDILFKAMMKILYPKNPDIRHLSTVATQAIRRVLNINFSTPEEARANQEFMRVWKDIRLFLRCWLVYSILFKMKMPIKDDMFNCLTTKKQPNYPIYIQIFKLIYHDLLKCRTKLMNQTIDCGLGNDLICYQKMLLELENKKEKKVILESFIEYLEKLIDLLTERLKDM